MSRKNKSTPSRSQGSKSRQNSKRQSNCRGRKSQGQPSTKERFDESVAMTRNGDITPDQRRLARSIADNDPSWYAQNPQLLRDYASYPFGYPLGSPPYPNSNYSQAIPGVAVAKFYPAVGVATGETSPINVAMRKLYSFVRYANSGAKNYDAPDLMLYVVAVDSARMFLEFMKRAYGVMLNYTAFNRYYPRALISAMGLNFDDLETQLNDFRGFINQYAVKLNQLWVPAGFSYFARHEWLCQHIYVDSNTSPKAQTYFFSPQGFYRFEVTGNPAVGQLTMQHLNPNQKLSDLISFGNNLLNPLITNEDIGIMSGDILKAYGDAGVLKTTGISEDYRILPEYSPEVQSQFENLVILRPNMLTSLNVTQDTSIGGGWLHSEPQCCIQPVTLGTIVQPATQYQQNVADALFAPLTRSRLINLHVTSPTPEDVIVATRGTITIDPASVKLIPQTNNTILATADVASLGSELFAYLYITYISSETGLPANFVYTSSATWYLNGDASPDGVAAAVSAVSDGYTALEQFDWHPLIDLYFMQTTDSDYAWSFTKWPFCDSDNYTFIDPTNLANMHSVALLSEFTVPMVS